MTVVFLHSPRTGGTSMIEMLAQQYGPVSREHFYRDGVWVLTDDGEAALRNQKAFKGKCILGHVPYGIHKHLGDKAVYMTMVRHPVSRIISLYHYVMGLSGGGRDWWANLGAIPDIPLEDFIGLPLCHLRNSMTRQFAEQHFRHQKTTKAVTKSTFARAAKNLDSMLVGILEHLEDSLDMFRRSLGWGPVEVLHLNDRDYEQPPVAVVRKIEALNKWDMKLYERCLAQFE